VVEPFRPILCPVDLSKNAHVALEYAAYMARQCDATVHLLYVIPPTDVQIPYARHGRPKNQRVTLLCSHSCKSFMIFFSSCKPVWSGDENDS
jgi:nucleotide-binding universal stress UspA family protein